MTNVDKDIAEINIFLNEYKDLSKEYNINFKKLIEDTLPDTNRLKDDLVLKLLELK